jgi:glycosidase
MQHAPWSRSANIYQVNVRQYTPEGTLNAFAAHLPRLRQMGVDILWLMPVQPTAKPQRKGLWSAHDAVTDHVAVNPALGTLDDFKSLVHQAHALDMKIMIEWVTQYAARDHVWVKQHPDWFLKNEPTQSTGVAQGSGGQKVEDSQKRGLDFSQKTLWTALTQAMLFWVKEADVDGFSCHSAGEMPLKFWQQARAKLDAQKPVFMLAGAEDTAPADETFDMIYDWALYELLNRIAQGHADVRDLKTYLALAASPAPADTYRMTFTATHNTHARQKHDAVHWGDAFSAMCVMAATLPGMPLVYSGQESGLHKVLTIDEKNTIDWQNFKYEKLYANLLAMKKKHPALHNGTAGATVEVFDADNHHILAFRRQKGIDVVSVQLNLSGQNQAFNLHGKARKLGAWEYQIQTS